MCVFHVPCLCMCRTHCCSGQSRSRNGRNSTSMWLTTPPCSKMYVHCMPCLFPDRVYASYMKIEPPLNDCYCVSLVCANCSLAFGLVYACFINLKRAAVVLPQHTHKRSGSKCGHSQPCELSVLCPS